MGDVNSRQGDLADQASGNNEVHIQLKLKQTDAKILQAIEEALCRIEKGTYGICRDCGEPIAAAAAERDSLDPRLHHLQGKAERVKAHRTPRSCCASSTATSSALRQRHVAAARLVSDYDFNNTYQYVINREDVHLHWLHDAVADHGGTPEDAPEPQIDAAGKGKARAGQPRHPRGSRRRRRRSSTRWRAARRAMTNARHPDDAPA